VSTKSKLEIKVREAQPADESEWHKMWHDYCTFYKVELAPDITNTLWARVVDSNFPIYSLVAEDESRELLGFTNYIPHYFTWATDLTCYLEDIFVKTNARGQGVDRKLIDAVIERAKENGWKKVYWHTATDNDAARRLYDRYCSADDFVRYTVRL
jgi:ribosomal protein S18 acetylase RimI-like enzyme